jgi:Cu/Ag efflux pump CusA
VGPTALLLIFALIATTGLGRAFLPDFNEGALTISAVTLPGTNLQESGYLGRLVDETLMEQPEVVHVARRTGRAELATCPRVESAEIDVSLSMKERSKAEFLDALRREFSAIPGMNITIGLPISHRIDHMLSGTRANVAVKIFGEDLSELRQLAEKARQAMSAVPGVVDLSVGTERSPKSSDPLRPQRHRPPWLTCSRRGPHTGSGSPGCHGVQDS